MTRRSWTSLWTKGVARSLAAVRRSVVVSTKAAASARKTKSKASPVVGAWLPGVALGAAGARRYRLYRPPGLRPGERVPLIVMLHGCGQDAKSFAASTRMNRIAAREGFIVLYPEQDRLANSQGCWNWFDTQSGRAFSEAALIMAAVEQVCLLAPVDRERMAVAGMSAGASMAALLVTRYPGHFKALVMHSGVPPGTAHSALTALRAMRGQRAAPPLAATPSTAADGWPALLVIHGTADNTVAQGNGHAAAQTWANAAGARAGTPRTVQRGKRRAMTVTDFKSRGKTVVTLADVAGLGHAWSGGAASEPFSDAQGPDASRMVWAFAAKQFAA